MTIFHFLSILEWTHCASTINQINIQCSAPFVGVLSFFSSSFFLFYVHPLVRTCQTHSSCRTCHVHSYSHPIFLVVDAALFPVLLRRRDDNLFFLSITNHHRKALTQWENPYIFIIIFIFFLLFNFTSINAEICNLDSISKLTQCTHCCAIHLLLVVVVFFFFFICALYCDMRVIFQEVHRKQTMR